LNRATKRAAQRDIARQERRLKQQGAVDLKQRPAKVPTISLGYCWNEARGVSGFWHQSVLSIVKGLAGRFAIRPIAVECGPAIAFGRNAVVESFLATEDEYLLFTDTDMMFGVRDVDLLLAADAPIAGALYFNAATGELPVATALVEGDDGAYAPLSLPELPDPPEQNEGQSDEEFAEIAGQWLSAKFIAEEPREVAGVGLGLTLIKREVVEAVKSVYERPFEFDGDNGEDLTFCLRAAEMGHRTVVVPGARIAHLKVGVI
jgi:hypothetical protein